MKKILHVILISLFSLTVISCAEEDDSTTSSGLFIAVGQEGVILTSLDGTTWTSSTSGSSEVIWNIYYENSTFVGVGASGTILTSSDGTTWTSRTSGTTEALFGITYGNGTFVVVGDNESGSGTILSSADGITWTS